MYINAIVGITRPFNLPLPTLPQYAHTIKVSTTIETLTLSTVLCIKASRKLMYLKKSVVLDFQVLKKLNNFPS